MFLEYNLASMQNEFNWMVIWTFFGIAFLGIRMKTDLFQNHVNAEVLKFADILSAAL